MAVQRISFFGIGGAITSPNGNTLYWNDSGGGGKGDLVCTPAAADKPFATGDLCASQLIIKVEQLPPAPTINGQYLINYLSPDGGLAISETKYDTGESGIAKNSMYVGNYNIPTDNTISYQICLDPYFKKDNGNFGPPQVGTNMGFLFPCPLAGLAGPGFDAIFPVKDTASFSSADANAAVNIMKSFSSYSAHSSADAVAVVQEAYQRADNNASSSGMSKHNVEISKSDFSSSLYGQLDVDNGIDQMFCTQSPPPLEDITASLVSSANGSAVVSVKGVSVTVDLASLTITKITCP